MGMDAELFAIGKFVPEAVDSLDYPSDFYSDTPTGSTIIIRVGGCCTSQQSEWLAEALGVSPWAFEEHCDLSGEDADLGLLVESLENGVRAVASFVKLRSLGFKFYYLPNG